MPLNACPYYILGPLATPTCPYCRQRMTVLLPFFSEEERNAADLDTANVSRRKQLYDSIRSYNRLFSGTCSTQFSMRSSIKITIIIGIHLSNDLT